MGVEQSEEEAPDEVLGEHQAVAGYGYEGEGVQGDKVQFAELRARGPLGERARECWGLERDVVKIVEEQRRSGRDQRSGDALFLLLSRSPGGDRVWLASERYFADAADEQTLAYTGA